MKARKFWKRGLALALSLALLITLVPTAFAKETKTPKTSSEAVDEMTWGVNLADLYMADIQPDEGATTGYDNFTPTAELGIAVWFWDDSFEWLTYHGSQRGTFTVHAPLPTYSSSTDKPFIRLGFFAKKPNQAFDVTLSDSKIVKSNQTEVSLPSLDTRYQGNAASEPDMNGWYSYALWDLPNLPEESAEYNGATFYTTVTINEGSVTTTSKADYYFEYGRTPIDQEDLTDTFLNEGANVIRLPVTWTWFVNDQTFEIDDEWLAAVKTEVDYILSKGAYCILDMHDDYMKRSFVATKNASTGQWENFKWTQDWMTGHAYDSLDGAAPSERPATPYDEYVDARFAEVWRQIAEYFKGCSDKLIFEACNEPTELWFDGVHYDEWIKAQAARVNELNQLFVNTVRATGGNNADRLLCLAVAEYNQHQHLSKLTPPKNDNYLMVQVHSYGEMEGKSDSGFQGYQTETDTLFNDVKTFQTAYPNIPVIVGEVGISHAAANIGSESNKAAAAEKVAYFYQKATENGVPCLWWEDYFRVPEEGSSDTYWLYDKTAKKWGRPEILAAIKSNAKAGTSTPVETALTSVTLSENTVTVQGGNAADIAVTAAAKDQAGGTFADVTWSISGGDAANVTIDPASGVITVKAKAKAGSYTVTATDSNSKTATATLTVKRAESRATTMTVSGGQNEILVPADNAANNASAAFTASVTDQFDDVFSGNVAWSISPATEGVSIGTDGVVTVTNAAKAAVTDTVGKQLTVTAACSGISGTAAIQVKRAASQVTTVFLTRGGAAVGGTDTLVIPAAGTAEYTYAVKVLDQYGAEIDGQAVAWTFTPAAADANVTFDNAGKVTVAAGAAANGTFTLKAEAGGQSAQTVITVKDISIDWPRVAVAENPTYGQKWSEIITLSGGSAALNGQTVAGSFTVKEAGDYPAAGNQNYTVNFTSADGAYNIDKAGEAVAIAKKPVTVKAVDITRIYGEGTPVQTYTVPDGVLVGNDTEDDLGTVELTTKSSSADVGTYPITGTCSNEGNYIVTVTPGTLTIVPADIGKAVIAAIAPVTYNGAPQTPQPAVTYSGATLTKDTDYTVTYTNNTNAGSAAVTVAGKGNYTGTLSKSFTISPKALADSMISWDSADAIIYDKTAKTPAYTVTDGSKALVKGKDYSEKFTNNVNAGSGAALTITGAGNYTGTAAKTFAIQKASLADRKPTITGTAAAGNVLTAKLEGVAAEEITWTWTVGSNPNAGTGSAYTVQPTDSNQIITVKAAASGTNYQGSTQPSDSVRVAKTAITGTVTIALSTDTDGDGAIDTGDTLTASASVTPPVAVTYQWYNNGTAIDGATSQTYTVAEGMTGTITVTAAPEADYEGSITSTAVEIGKNALTGTVTVSGATAVGSVLTTAISVSPATENDYDITWLRDGAAIDGAAETVYTITKDDLGKTISVKITAKAESAYTGELVSTGTLIPAIVPDAPVLTLAPSSGSITARWTAPADNGAAITGYTLVITDGDQYSDTVSVDSSTASYTFSGLTNGTTYTVTITAMNSVGTGAAAQQTAAPRTSGSTGGIGGDTPITPSNPEPTVETETAPDGTVTTTTTWPDGKKIVQEKAPDGGAKVEVTSSTGETIAKVELPADPGVGKDFEDVKEGAWYEDAVDKATAYGLFNGQTETTFAPNGSMTRGMVAQVLYNLSGKTGYGAGSGNFADVPAGKWYENAINWAAKSQVVSGMGGGKFAPEQSVTREQLVSMLYRYAQTIGANTKATTGLGSFPDGNSVSDYAKAAMQWAVAEGFISGRANGGKNYIAPQGTATRAEVAAMLTRFVEYLKK